MLLNGIQAKEAKNKATRVWALYQYSATRPDELTIQQGDALDVLASQKESEGWWKVRHPKDGSVGFVPSCYLGAVPPIKSL